MLGCLISLRICISRDTLSISLWSLIWVFSSILTATFSPVGMWIPLFTVENVPAPRVLARCKSVAPTNLVLTDN